MGFSGGGSNVLLPHTHDGRISQDGGPLQFNNVTQSQSSAGQVFYSDGVALQQLAYPGVPAGETLTAAALSTAPSWAAAPAASVVWEQLASVTLGAPGQLSSGVFSAKTLLDIWIIGANVNVINTAVTFNNDNAAHYRSGQFVDGVYSMYADDTEVTILASNDNDEMTFLHMLTFYDSVTTDTGYMWNGSNTQGSGGADPVTLSGWGYYHGSQITEIEKSQFGAILNSQQTGARIVVFGAL